MQKSKKLLKACLENANIQLYYTCMVSFYLASCLFMWSLCLKYYIQICIHEQIKKKSALNHMRFWYISHSVLFGNSHFPLVFWEFFDHTMVSGYQMLAVAGLSLAMGVEPFSGWIPDVTTTTISSNKDSDKCADLSKPLLFVTTKKGF